jgi:hypothetical protein
VSSETRIRELVALALRELPRMRLADGTYCLEVHANDMRPRGRSLRYSAIVALGLLRARSAGYPVGGDVDELVELLLAQHDDPSLDPGDLGLLLWLGRRAGRSQADALLAALDRRLLAAGGVAAREGMEVAWIAIGTSECVAGEACGPAEDLMRSARAQLCHGSRSRSGLLLHRAAGARRRFPNFATQSYGTLALTKIGRSGDQEALDAARGVADALLALQRADGGWPWIFDAEQGRVVEPYPIYTVHQDAMAPIALLELHEATGDERYRAAAVRGIDWIYGQNDLRRSMLDADRRILYRSIRRRPPWDRALLYANTAAAFAGLSQRADWLGSLELNRTDRPYHLGWVLEAWCGRGEFAS